MNYCNLSSDKTECGEFKSHRWGFRKLQQNKDEFMKTMILVTTPLRLDVDEQRSFFHIPDGNSQRSRLPRFSPVWLKTSDQILINKSMSRNISSEMKYGKPDEWIEHRTQERSRSSRLVLKQTWHLFLTIAGLSVRFYFKKKLFLWKLKRKY